MGYSEKKVVDDAGGGKWIIVIERLEVCMYCIVHV